MAISFQGDWTFRVKRAVPGHRLLVEGAEEGDGVHDLSGGRCVRANGLQWTLSVEARGAGRWTACEAQRLGAPAVEAGALKIALLAGEDVELEASFPLHPAEHVLHGQVGSYGGGALFNPGRDDYLVLDPPSQLRALHGPLGFVLRRLYPEGLPRRLAPMVVPTGLPRTANGLVFEPEGLSTRVVARRSGFRTPGLAAGQSQLHDDELEAIAALREAGLRLRGPIQPVPGLVLQLLAYEPVESERAGGPYIGRGARRELGVAVSDDLGRYLCRFRRPAAHAARPDVVFQVLGMAGQPLHETAPYNSVANLQRVDLCVPREAVAAAWASTGARAAGAAIALFG